MTDSDGAATTAYTYRITNTGNLTYSFNIKMLATGTPTLNTSYIKIKVDNDTPVLYSNLTNNIIKSNVTLAPGKSIDISIRIWLDWNTPNSEIGHTFTATIATDGVATEPPLDTSGANEPELVTGLIPIKYQEHLCGELVNPTEATYPECYEYTTDTEFTQTDIDGFIAMYVNWGLSQSDATTIVNGILTNGEYYFEVWDGTYTLDYLIDNYGYDGTLTTPKDFISTNIYDVTIIKADESNSNSTYQWYDYNNKMWANAVLVSSTNRSTYQSASPGTTISSSDILAYYVWIPRYKYKVWNITKTIGVDSYDAENTGIDIIFESGTASTGTISCTYDFTVTDGSLSETCTGSNGDYYTHPAFTFGSDELTGIWVGKYALSSETPNATYGGGTADSLTPRVLPGVSPWLYNRIDNFFKVIYDMQTSNNIYGLSTDKTDTDSHMIKSLEWGAVAYLSNSDYGRCSNGSCSVINENNYFLYDDVSDLNYYQTGCGSRLESIEVYYYYDCYTCYEYYTDTGTLASTTGNVYGIYDMNTEFEQHIMANISSTAGSYTYDQSRAGSNFTYSLATSKYIDTYAYNSARSEQSLPNLMRLGDAMGETDLGDNNSWHKGGHTPYDEFDSFLIRPGYTGLFGFSITAGDGFQTYSARTVLVGL